VERLADPNYRATIPESPSATADRNTTAKRRNSNTKKASAVNQGTETDAAANMTTALASYGMAETTNTTDATSTMNPDNIFDFDNGAQVNTGIMPARFNVTAPPMYSGVVVENPQYSDFLVNPDTVLNTQNNTFENVQTQDHQPSDLRQESSDYQELRRKPSNVMMIDAQPDTIQAPPQFDSHMQGMVNEPPYWTSTNSLCSNAFPPGNMNHNLQGSIEDVSSLPPNNMNHNIHGPLGSPSLLPPNNINQNSGGLMFNMPWYGGSDAINSSSLASTFLISHQSNGNQNESVTNDTGTSDRFDINADPSTYPDPVEECIFDRYLKNPDSPS
jgi:hypothetical protein